MAFSQLSTALVFPLVLVFRVGASSDMLARITGHFDQMCDLPP